MSNIFIISGPSGAGEDSVMEGLQKILPIERIVNTTSRAMRPNESNGTPYWFVSEEKFINKIESNEFIEWAKQYNGNYYGVTKDEIERVKKTGKITVWKIEWQGVMTVKKIHPEIRSIFIMAPSLQILESRIRRRQDVSEEYVKERMEYSQEWMKHQDIYDYKVINEEGKLEETIQKVAEIIKNELGKIQATTNV
ncbi:MAG: guanylate kinase [Candidatus Moraniibacteriota bacterium]